MKVNTQNLKYLNDIDGYDIIEYLKENYHENINFVNQHIDSDKSYCRFYRLGFSIPFIEDDIFFICIGEFSNLSIYNNYSCKYYKEIDELSNLIIKYFDVYVKKYDNNYDKLIAEAKYEINNSTLDDNKQLDKIIKLLSSAKKLKTYKTFKGNKIEFREDRGPVNTNTTDAEMEEFLNIKIK